MCLFLDLLPTDLQICIVLTWIAADCCDDAGILSVLSALDIACCSHGSRPACLDLAAGFPFVDHTQSKLFADTASYLAWMQDRHVQVRCLYLTPESRPDSNLTVALSVKHVRFQRCDVPTAIRLVALCPNLTSLHLHVSPSAPLAQVTFPYLKRVDFDGAMTDSFSQFLARNGSQLESLSICGWAPTTDVGEFCDALARHCPVLAELRIKYLPGNCVSEAITLLRMNPLIKLDISCHTTLSDADITRILTATGARQHLKSIRFHDNYSLSTFTFCLSQADILGLEFVQAGGHSFCRLTSHLVLYFVVGETPSDGDVDNLLAVLPTIKQLTLMCCRLSVAMLNKIGEKCGNAVKDMCIRNMSFEDFHATSLLSQHCTVQKLTLHLWVDAGRTLDALLFDVQLSKLLHLDAEYGWIAGGVGFLTVTGMLEVFRSCTSLQTLKCAVDKDALVFATLQAIVDNRVPLRSFTYSSPMGRKFAAGDLERFRQLAKEEQLLPVTTIVHVS